MTVGAIAAAAFQSLVVAELVALVVARSRMEATTVQALGRSWHHRLEELTYLVRPALVPALLLVSTLIASAALASVLGAQWPAAVAFVLSPLLAGAVTWWVARDRDWDRIGREAAHSS